MLHVFHSLAICSLLSFGSQTLYAVDVHNICNAQYPGVTEKRATGLMGFGYEAVDAANKNERSRLRGLLFTVKREVESMMRAQVKMDDFVDDAFKQSANNGYKFPQSQIDQAKRNLGISPKACCDFDRELLNIFNSGDIDEDMANIMRYPRYSHGEDYEPPVRLEGGLNLVIIGGLVAFIPYPGCAEAGKWIAGLGLGFMAEACMKGCEKQQDIRQNHYEKKDNWR